MVARSLGQRCRWGRKAPPCHRAGCRRTRWGGPAGGAWRRAAGPPPGTPAAPRTPAATHTRLNTRRTSRVLAPREGSRRYHRSRGQDGKKRGRPDLPNRRFTVKQCHSRGPLGAVPGKSPDCRSSRGPRPRSCWTPRKGRSRRRRGPGSRGSGRPPSAGRPARQTRGGWAGDRRGGHSELRAPSCRSGAGENLARAIGVIERHNGHL